MHKAYRFVLGFDDDLVASTLERLGASKRHSVLDPFSGTGTTLVECKKRGIDSIGFDANPVCVLISKAKLDWGIGARRIEESVKDIVKAFDRRYAAYLRAYRLRKRTNQYYSPLEHPLFERTTAGRFLIESGILKRGWMSPRPALKTLLLTTVINERVGDTRTQRFLLTSLLDLLVPEISNMRYGPEIYRAVRRRDVDVIGLFKERVQANLSVLNELRQGCRAFPSSSVSLGDSVNGGLNTIRDSSLDFVVTSPPYPSEHDYTRLTRLELIFSGFVSEKADIRTIKQRLLRCCTRNIYSGDNKYKDISRFRSVRGLVDRISEEAQNHSHGFAKLYSRVVEEYFGGMFWHFQHIARVLRLGGRCAYIVGDQASFFSIQIKTAELLSRIATSKGVGLREIEAVRLRPLRGTTGRQNSNYEWLLILEK
ncbi:MAG: DNA methyltransferase [Acidobacteriota bacterium]